MADRTHFDDDEDGDEDEDDDEDDDDDADDDDEEDDDDKEEEAMAPANGLAGFGIGGVGRRRGAAAVKRLMASLNAVPQQPWPETSLPPPPLIWDEEALCDASQDLAQDEGGPEPKPTLLRHRV
jgi:hypothetical protein